MAQFQQLCSQFSNRLTIVTGHYGTGKTEFSVNLALALAKNQQTMLADLDIVNPYFRSRERRDILAAAGVELVASSQACVDADVPSLPAQLLTVLQHPTARGVLDIGGDAVGARVLARFAPQIQVQDHQMVFVVNANRPETATVDKAMAYLQAIEQTTHLTCAGLVHNTHLCGETTAQTVEEGAILAQRLSEKTGLPILCHVAKTGLNPNVSPLFSIDIQMKKPWEQ
ncbi:hypothetical protein RFF05_13595 [Bengtsoniella intestinalis]|uniref:hypothetical protein n=1 Tax=Bengtsoniella intestinalis TaxID=3073143 RepID=UPI00391F22CA